MASGLVVLGLLLYLVFPFGWALVSSFKPNEELFATPARLLPEHPTLEHYRKVLANDDFLDAVRNSVVVASSTTAVSLAIGALAAFSLGRYRFRGRSLVLYVVLSMTLFPQIAILGALFEIVNVLGLYNRLSALTFSYLVFTLPFTIWVLTGFVEAVPVEIEEAAYVDGASPFQVFTKIMLPLAAPGMVTTGFLSFIAAWNELLFALSFTQTPDKRTVTYAIMSFSATTSSAFEIPWGQMMAASVLVTTPLVLVALALSKAHHRGPHGGRSERLIAWAEAENAEGHFCACGCGRQVVVLPTHRHDGIPKYVPEHRPSRFGTEIQGLHDQGLMTALDVAKELRLQRKAVHPLADEIIGETPRIGSRQIRVFTRKQFAKLQAALARRASPRHDLTDAQWKRVAPIVSSTERTPWSADMRAVVNAIRWIQRTGMQWEALPERFPPRKTCQAHFRVWRLDGRWAMVCQVS